MSKACGVCAGPLVTSFEQPEPHCPVCDGGTRVCEECGSPEIQGQPFSGGEEYYCPRCDDTFAYRARTEKLPDGALPHVYTGLIEEEVVRDCTFFPNARLSKLGLDAYALCWGAKDWTDFMVRFGVSPQTRSQHTMVLTILATWLPELEARNAEIARLRELLPLNGFGTETNVRQLIENHRAWTQAAHDRAARADLAWELLRGMARKVTKLRRQARVMAGSSERFFRAGLRNRQKLEALQAEVEELREQRNAAQGEAAKLRKELATTQGVLNYVEKGSHKESQRSYNLLGYLLSVEDMLEDVGCQADECAGVEYGAAVDAWTCSVCTTRARLKSRVDNAFFRPYAWKQDTCSWCDKSLESAEIARARAEVKRVRDRVYVAWKAMGRYGLTGVRAMDELADTRKRVLFEAMRELGWVEFDDAPPTPVLRRLPASCFCDVCGGELDERENHYHCQKCGGRTSMMGHQNGCPPISKVSHQILVPPRDPSQDVVPLVDDDEEES